MSQSNPTDFQANAYAENYVLYGDQSKAFKSAFPESKAKAAHIHTKASLLHNVAKVQQRITEINSKLAKQSDEEFGVKVSDLKKMLLKAAVGGLTDRIDAQENKVLNNISGAVSAISEINRMDGNHHQYKMEIDHNHRVIDDGSDEW